MRVITKRPIDHVSVPKGSLSTETVSVQLVHACGRDAACGASCAPRAVIDNRVNFPCRAVTPYTCVPYEIAFLCIGCHGGRPMRAGGCDSISAGISSKILITFELDASPPFVSETQPVTATSIHLPVIRTNCPALLLLQGIYSALRA